MNERDLQLALDQFHADLRASPAPSDLRDKVLAIPTTRTHRWSLPPVPEWRLRAVFGAAKFVVAGAILALFGGLLLSGVLMQPQATEPPIPASTPAASATAPDESIRAGLLPGVELMTEQVAPTVFRVVDDGPEHNLSHIWRVAIDQNDAVWVLTWQPRTGKYPRIFRLGEPGAYTPADGIPRSVEGIEIGADGRLYANASTPGRVTLDDWVVLTEQGWQPATKEDRQAANRRPDRSVGTKVAATDGTTWEVDRYIHHHGPDPRKTYRLEDMGFAWGKKWLKETGPRKMRPQLLAAAPDGRVWSLWDHTPDDFPTPGFALAEFDGAAWRDITPQQWRYRLSTWPLGDGRPGWIFKASMSVGPDGALRLAALVHDPDMRVEGGRPVEGGAPVERIEARWDGSDWTIESRTSWDLASIPEPSGEQAHYWMPHWASDGTMVLKIGWDPLDTLLYVIEPEIDDSFDEDVLMAP